jgi:hypothetical protein
MAIKTTYKVMYWKDIPSMIEAEDSSGDEFKLSMGEKYEALIDAKAMELGLAGSDEYIDNFAYGDEIEMEGTAEDVANKVKEQFETQFA